MTGTEIVLSVPADVACVPLCRPGPPARPAHVDVLIPVPDYALAYARRRAAETGQPVETILGLLIAEGIAASISQEPQARGLCKNGKPHVPGSINPRHCFGCGIPM